MKRRTVHVMFGGAAAICAVLAGYEGWRLHEALRVNEAIVAADAEVATSSPAVARASAPEDSAAGSSATAGRVAASSPASGSDANRAMANGGAAAGSAAHTDAAVGALDTSVPEAQFARAVALAKRGDYDGALKQYKLLSRGSRADLATDALYNAGNLQLREALKEGRDAAVRALPLIELAKQSYRGVLRRDPQSWDARYNLERALWLAPELDEVLTESVTRNAENRVMSTLQSTRADLP